MKIKHCTYAKEIFLCFVCDYGHYGDIRNKGTIKQNNRPGPSGCFKNNQIMGNITVVMILPFTLL